MYFLLFIVITFFLIVLFIEKNIYNPGVVFFGIWIVVFLLYAFNPYSLPAAKPLTIFTFALGIVCFGVGLFFAYSKKRALKCSSEKTGARIVNSFFNPFIVLLIQLFATILFFYLAIPGIKTILNGGTLATIRYEIRLMTLSNNINGVLLTYFAIPILYFSVFYSLSTFVSKCKCKYRTLSFVLTVLMIMFEILILGGRMSTLVTLSSLIVAIFIYLGQIKTKKRKRKILMLLFAAVFIVAIGFTKMVVNRGNDDPFKSFAIYLYGSIPFLDSVIDSFNAGRYSYCFGFLSLQGFSSPIVNLVGASNLDFFVNVDNVYRLIDSYIYFNGSIPFNSEISMFGYFFLDGGVVAVAIFSSLFGYLSGKYYLLIRHKAIVNTRNISLYMLILGAIVMSFIQFSFASVGYALSLVIILFTTKTKPVLGVKYENYHLCCDTAKNRF